MIPTKNLPLLMDLAYGGVNNPAFQPTISSGAVVTHCNQFIQAVCNGFGYSEFAGMVANQMVDFMSDPKNGWITVSDEVAQSHANSGVIVVAGRRDPYGHGHVCLIVPGLLENSGSYGKSVPKCANVGKDVFFGKKVSWSFDVQMMPTYFVLGGMI